MIRIHTRKRVEGLSGTVYIQGKRTEKSSGKVSANLNYSFNNGMTLFGGVDFNDNAFQQKREYKELFDVDQHTDTYQQVQKRSYQWNANAGCLYDYGDNSVGLSYELERIPRSKFYSIGKELTTVSTFEDVKECNTKIDVNSENQIVITLFLTVTDNVVIKELATGIQNKIKEEIKKISDLEVQEVNVKIVKLQETNQNEE